MAAANRWKANAAIIALNSDASNEAYGAVGLLFRKRQF